MVETYVVNAVTLSALYALVAIGFTLIFGVGRVFNFAHGALILLGGYVAFLVSNAGGLPIAVGIALGAVVPATAAGLIYLGVVRRIQDRPVVVLLVTLIVGFIAQHTVRVVYGIGAFTVPQPVEASVTAGGFEVRAFQVFVFVSSWVLILGVLYLVTRTTTGKTMVATSQDRRGAALAGIDTERVNLYTWILAGSLAGFAGVMLAGFQTGDWYMGVWPMVISFAIVILGGLGSIKGSIVGAYVVGFLETTMTTYVNPRMTGVASLILLIGFLLVRPTGLFGHDVEI